MGDGCSVSSECKRALFFSPPLVHRPPDGRTDGGKVRRRMIHTPTTPPPSEGRRRRRGTERADGRRDGRTEDGDGESERACASKQEVVS